jgi:hypothetical protein
MPESKHSKRRLASIDRQHQALELRKAGLSYRVIGEQIGTTPQGAQDAVERAIRRVLRDPADAVLQLELERLDAMFTPMYRRAREGDVGALHGALAVMGRRAKLLGMDIDRQEHSGPGGGPLATEARVTVYLPDNGRPNVVPQQD